MMTIDSRRSAGSVVYRVGKVRRAYFKRPVSARVVFKALKLMGKKCSVHVQVGGGFIVRWVD